MKISVKPKRTGNPPAEKLLEDQGWLDFRAQCRRQMERPLALRIKYGFSRPIRPSANGGQVRVFKNMADYRTWCEANMADYLGFKRRRK